MPWQGIPRFGVFFKGLIILPMSPHYHNQAPFAVSWPMYKQRIKKWTPDQSWGKHNPVTNDYYLWLTIDDAQHLVGSGYGI